MNNDITTEERIDNYLLGRMSEAEKAAFERDLETDAELKEEYVCQKAIANAVQKVEMRDFITQYAAERQKAGLPVAADLANTNENVIDLTSIFSRISEKVQGFFSSGQRVALTFASVAAMLVAVIGGVNYTSTLSTMRNEGMIAYADLSAPIARDGNQIDILIEQAYSQIGNSKWDDAMASIGKVRTLISDSLSDSATTEEEVYEQQILKSKEYELDWYEAIILMKQGKIRKAKRVLESISVSDSPYAENAKDELNKIF